MEIISLYSRKQAIADKQQFNVDDLIPGLRNVAGIKYPVYITASIKNIIDQSMHYGGTQLKDLLWDILFMFRLSAKKAVDSENKYRLSFKIDFYWKNQQSKSFTFYAEVGATEFDNPDPAITIMTKNDS